MHLDRGFWRARRWTASLSGWVRQLTADGGMLVVPPSQGTWDQGGCLLFYSPLRFPSVPITAPKRLKSLKSIQIMTSRQRPPVCVFSCGVCGGDLAQVWSKTSLSECESALSAHLHSPTHASIRYRLPTEVLCFDRGGERGGEFFFWLWKMEASFMTHVPCPPVKITPAVFQHCSIIGCAANENNGACGEETRQTKRKKRPLGRKYLQVYFIHIHHPFPSHQTLR